LSAFGCGGTNVVRLSAFILLCIGIEILWSGVKELMHLTWSAQQTSSTRGSSRKSYAIHTSRLTEQIVLAELPG
jgi:hypothetical protein